MNTNSVTKAYHEEWRRKANEPGRLDCQIRATGTLSDLFKYILHTPLQGRVLDLGCGDGTIVEAFNQTSGTKAFGIDIAQGIDFESDPLPYKDDEFDIALMYSVIEHIYNPGNILKETKRVIRKGGHLIVITPNFDLNNLFTCDRTFYDDPTHVHPYCPTSLDHLLRLYQFNTVFLGLWTVKKPISLWRLPMPLQFAIGAALPFRGDTHWAPSILRGKSRTILGVFENDK